MRNKNYIGHSYSSFRVWPWPNHSMPRISCFRCEMETKSIWLVYVTGFDFPLRRPKEFVTRKWVWKVLCKGQAALSLPIHFPQVVFENLPTVLGAGVSSKLFPLSVSFHKSIINHVISHIRNLKLECQKFKIPLEYRSCKG